jgi:hypothetical protein
MIRPSRESHAVGIEAPATRDQTLAASPLPFAQRHGHARAAPRGPHDSATGRAMIVHACTSSWIGLFTRPRSIGCRRAGPGRAVTAASTASRLSARRLASRASIPNPVVAQGLCRSVFGQHQVVSTALGLGDRANAGSTNAAPGRNEDGWWPGIACESIQGHSKHFAASCASLCASGITARVQMKAREHI